MKRKQMVRRMDLLGRVVLPIELRRALNLLEGASVEVFVEGQEIILRRYSPCCLFCQSIQDVILLQGKKVCLSCAREISKGASNV